MNPETGQKSNFNLGSSYITSETSDYQTAEYAGYFFWASYFHQLNQQPNRQAMINFSTQVGPQNYLNLTEKGLNLTHPIIQGCNYSPISSPSPSPSSNMKDLCSYNPSNSSKNGKNPQTDNNSLKCRPNCDDWNSEDDISKYIANFDPFNQCSISENLNGNCRQKLVVADHGGNEYRKEMTAVKRDIPSSFEITKPMQRRAYHETCPIKQPQSMYQTKEYAVVDELQMDEIIAKELDLALSLSKKGRKNPRVHRLNHQAKQKSRPKTGKKSSIKNKLISITVERIKAAVFNCNPNPPSFKVNKISDHEAKQQSKQDQSFPQPEAWNQYQANNTSGQFQHPQLMCQPKPGVMRQPSDPQFFGRKPKRYCTCKTPDARMINAFPSSSASVSSLNVPSVISYQF